MDGLFRRLLSKVSPKAVTKSEDQKRGEGSTVNFDEYVFPDVEGESSILDKDDIEFIDRNLPERMVGVRWILVYSTEVHGSSIKTMYRNLRFWDNPVVLVAEDAKGFRFGAFGTEPFRPDYKVHGSAECFVFRLKHPREAKKLCEIQTSPGRETRGRGASDGDFVVIESDKESGSLQGSRKENFGENDGTDASEQNCDENQIPSEKNVDGTTGANIHEDDVRSQQESQETKEKSYDYSVNKVWKWSNLEGSIFIHGEGDILRFGLNDGFTTLWVNEDLTKGGSDECRIFMNERLAGDDIFDINLLEVWGFKQ